jgi:hypothetical protein
MQIAFGAENTNGQYLKYCPLFSLSRLIPCYSGFINSQMVFRINRLIERGAQKLLAVEVTSYVSPGRL